MQSLHTHTSRSDGQNTPEEMILAAIAQRLDTIAVTDHSHTPFDESYCIPSGCDAAYRAELAALKEKYRGRIDVLIGIEQDRYADTPADGYEWIVGSVHYLRFGDEYVAVDEDAERLVRAAERYCGGDIYRVTELYFETVAELVQTTNCSIIGHFDLIACCNEKTPFFDESHPRYRKQWQAAVDALLPSGVPFEVNTHAVEGGKRSDPYPASEIRDYIRSRGGKLIYTADSHRCDTLTWGFR